MKMLQRGCVWGRPPGYKSPPLLQKTAIWVIKFYLHQDGQVFCSCSTYFCSLISAAFGLLDLEIRAPVWLSNLLWKCDNYNVAILSCMWRNSLKVHCIACIIASWWSQNGILGLSQRSYSFVVEAVACPFWVSFTLSKKNPFPGKPGTPASQMGVILIKEP